jgi:hypothetical protein
VARALRAAEQVAPGRTVVEIAPGGVIRIRTVDDSSPQPTPSEPLAPARKWRL